MLAGAPLAAAQAPAIDREDPCVNEGLPALSRDGRRIAFVRCWADLSDALEASFVVLDARTGRTIRRVVLAARATGGERPTPVARVRRNVDRAQRELTRGGFVSMIPLEGRRLAVSGGALVALDERGRETGRAPLPSYPRNPFCCGGDVDDTTPCSLPPELAGAWTAGGAVIARIRAGMNAPDGCEGGPDFVLLPTRSPG